MTEERFWQIVEEIDWPNVHYRTAMRTFTDRHTVEEADEMRAVLAKKKSELRRAARVDEISDSWDDALAHIVGLGKAEFSRCLADAQLIIERHKKLDYEESFAYCIPYDDDFAKRTDSGFDRYRHEVEELIVELETTDADDIAPRLYRQIPLMVEVGRLLVQQQWREALSAYHRNFGPGYADTWPLHNYLIPNFILDLEELRLPMADDQSS